MEAKMYIIKRILSTWVIILLILVVFGLGVLITFAQVNKQSDKPLSCEEILKLFKSKMDQARIIEQVKNLQVDCDLNSNTEMYRELILANASVKLLDTIKKNQYSEIIITFPKPGAEAGATIKVEGKSKKIKGKYLWIFTQREGLEIWWPQGGTVKLKENGDWRQGVFLGAHQDIGYDFVIIAKWVDKKINRELKDYLAKGERTRHYPGIPLPSGSPSEKLSVHKVRH
jgi:hypothetical protein